MKILRKCKCGNTDDYFIIEKGSIYQTTVVICNVCGRKRTEQH